MFYRIQMAIFRYPKMKFLICYSKKNQWNLKNKVGFFLSRKLDNFIFSFEKKPMLCLIPWNNVFCSLLQKKIPGFSKISWTTLRLNWHFFSFQKTRAFCSQHKFHVANRNQHLVRNVKCTLRTKYPSFVETKNMRQIHNAEWLFVFLGDFVRNIKCMLRTKYPSFVETKKHEENTLRWSSLFLRFHAFFFQVANEKLKTANWIRQSICCF
jgi:hypothetical protein